MKESILRRKLSQKGNEILVYNIEDSETAEEICKIAKSLGAVAVSFNGRFGFDGPYVANIKMKNWFDASAMKDILET